MDNESLDKGYFVTLEGIEGVGKSTHLRYIHNYLKEKEISVVVSREPGGTPVAESIRKVLLSHQEEAVTPQTELLLLFACRSQNVVHLIKPALSAGSWVVCDRFTDATYAYQGYGRGLPLEEIAALEQCVQGDLRPDLVILFDAPVDVALRRVRDRSKKPDRFESEQEEFFERVRNGYLKRAEQFPQRYRIIDASVPLSKVRSQVKALLEEKIKR